MNSFATMFPAKSLCALPVTYMVTFSEVLRVRIKRVKKRSKYLALAKLVIKLVFLGNV